MGVAQCVIAILLLRQAVRRYSRTIVALLVLGLAAAGVILLVGALSEFQRFGQPIYRIFNWRIIDLAHTVTFLWCLSSTPALLLYFITRWAANRFASVHQPERRKFIVNAGRAVIAVPFAIAGYGATIGRTGFQVREIDLPVANLPEDLSRLRIVQLSDLHLSPYLSETELARAIDMANELRPDIALVTGDLISGSRDPIDAALKQCARLRAERILGVLGNHERYAGRENYTAMHGARLGINFLRSQSEVLRFGSAELNFGGVDYQPFKDRGHYLTGAESLLRPGAVNVLLSHNPDVFPIAARQGWDATLAGHTHGGQVTVEILTQTLNLARIYTPYVMGLYELDGKCCYVTRGIGTIGIPARIGVPPEITLIRLVRGPVV